MLARLHRYMAVTVHIGPASWLRRRTYTFCLLIMAKGNKMYKAVVCFGQVLGKALKIS